MSIRTIALATAVFSLAVVAQAAAQSAGPAKDWTTWGYDQQRSGWNRGETSLTKANVSKLRVIWKVKLSTPPRDVVLSTLTAPVVVEGVVTSDGTKDILLSEGADDVLFALDAATGKELWHKSYSNSFQFAHPATWLCSNTAQATPVIDKNRNLIFFLTSEGKLRALSLADGTERMTPTDMADPFSRDWSLNLIDNVVYTQGGRGCGQLPGQQPEPLQPQSPTAADQATPNSAARGAVRRPTGPVVMGSIMSMDVHDLDHPVLARFFTSHGRPAGPWGRGGVVLGVDKQVLTTTADGPVDPGAGSWGETLIALAPKLMSVMNSFTPSNWQYLNSHDLDMGSASVVTFPFQNRTLVATASKEGVLYILDAARLGDAPAHSSYLYKSPQLGNDAALGTQPGEGVWGSITTYASSDGKRYLYVPIWGPASKQAPQFEHTDGPLVNGGVMAFEVVSNAGSISVRPAWTSPNMVVPDSPTVANGIVFATQTGEQTLQHIPANPGEPSRPANGDAENKFRSTPVSNLVLYAFDAETGKQLYSSKKTIDDWVHFSEPVVALGKVFVVTHSGWVYAFGAK